MNSKLSSCENLVVLSKEIVLNYLDYTSNNGCEGEEHIVSDMHECLLLCDKLLNENYFIKSEQLLEDKCNELLKNRVVRDKWFKIYNKELRVKKKDLSTLFKLITRNIEEI